MPREVPRELLFERLRALTVTEHLIIGEDTEIYKDLAISGDDLEELILWIQAQFNVDFSELNLEEYAPGEGVSFRLRKYSSLTVRDLLAAVESGRFRSATR